MYSQLKKLRDELQGAEMAMGYPPDDEEQYEELREITRQINKKYGRHYSESVVHSYFQTFLLYRNTVTTEALVHLTLGGLPAVYNGGLLQVSVRYFDADAKRPGLPKDVAALVSSVQKKAISLTLCNLHPLESRKVIVQAGAFGEHYFDNVTNNHSDQVLQVEGRWFEVELNPGTLIELDVAMCRWMHQPSYAEPFDQ